MPKKLDPTCAFCRVLKEDPDTLRTMPIIAELERSVLVIDMNSGAMMMIAHAHMQDADAMYPAERDLYMEDRATVMQALASVYPAVDAETITGDHLCEAFNVSSDVSLMASFPGDVREALGYIREPITDPYLKPLTDHQGRLTDWPGLKKPEAQTAVREYLATKFEPDRAYTEKEVNAIVNAWTTFSDQELMRRELFNVGLLFRYKDGSKYWVGDTEPV